MIMKTNALSDEIYRKLSEHPINVKRVEKGELPGNLVLLRGCGIKLKAEPFNHKFNTKAAAICPTAIIAGIMLSVGIDRIEPEGATGDYHSNLLAKSEAAYKALYKDDYDFVFLHVKAYDEAGHDKCVEQRTKITNKIEEMIGDFMKRASAESVDCVVAMTGDHSTPLYYGDHSFEPVPFVMTTKDAFHGKSAFFLQDACEKFSEVDAAKGLFGRFAGRNMMQTIFKVRDRLVELGNN